MTMMIDRDEASLVRPEQDVVADADLLLRAAKQVADEVVEQARQTASRIITDAHRQRLQLVRAAAPGAGPAEPIPVTREFLVGELDAIIEAALRSRVQLVGGAEHGGAEHGGPPMADAFIFDPADLPPTTAGLGLGPAPALNHPGVGGPVRPRG